MREGKLPDSWKLAGITPIPKKANTVSNDDFRPIALTSILMKCFEQIMKKGLLSFLKLDECQFAYKQKRSTKDACISLDYFFRSPLKTPSAYARILFVDFSSAFNTIVPDILLQKLCDSNVPTYIISFISAFLKNRKQYVTVGEKNSDVLKCDIGCPQGCVLSPVLFSIYTDFIRATQPNVQLLKYADDMALIVLLNFQKEDSSFYFNAVNFFVNQCKSVNLLINASKTKEMVVSFSRLYGIYDHLFIDNNVI